MILDVACGDNPKGHVNLDLFLEETEHRRSRIKVGKVKNFVRGDARALPFRDGAFTVVIASHILEHLERPLDVLREWGRVASRVIVVVPSYTGLHVSDMKSHIYTWSAISFENLLRRVFREVKIIHRPHYWGAWHFKKPRHINTLLKKALLFLPILRMLELEGDCKK